MVHVHLFKCFGGIEAVGHEEMIVHPSGVSQGSDLHWGEEVAVPVPADKYVLKDGWERSESMLAMIKL